MGDAFTLSTLMSVSRRWAYGFFERVAPVLDRHHGADVERRSAAVDVGPHVGREGAAGPERGAPARAEGELRVSLGLLLIRHGQDAPVASRFDEMAGHDARRAAD